MSRAQLRVRTIVRATFYTLAALTLATIASVDWAALILH